MDGRTAARAFSNDGLFFLEKFLVFFGKERIGFHKLLCHCFNVLHEVLRVGVSLCNQRQCIFPFRSQFRGSQIVRQDADKVAAVLRGNEGFALALYKAGVHQFFNDSGAGGRRA